MMNEPMPHRPDGESAGSLPGSNAKFQQVDQLPQWRIVLHDDEVHEPLDMIELVCATLPLSRYAATRRVLETHRHGMSILLHAHQELAELYYLQLSKQNLIVTIEKE